MTYGGWHALWTACARGSSIPWFVGIFVLLATRGTTNWIPSGCTMLGCQLGLALSLTGMFGLIGLRRRHADEAMPWSRTTFWCGALGIVGSLMVGSASVLVLSTIDVNS